MHVLAAHLCATPSGMPCTAPTPRRPARQVNTNGFLVGDDELYAAQADTKDLMRLVGADGLLRHGQLS